MKTSPIISNSVKTVGFLNSLRLPNMVLIKLHSPFYTQIEFSFDIFRYYADIVKFEIQTKREFSLQSSGKAL